MGSVPSRGLLKGNILFLWELILFNSLPLNRKVRKDAKMVIAELYPLIMYPFILNLVTEQSLITSLARHIVASLAWHRHRHHTFKFYSKLFICDGQDTVRRAILYVVLAENLFTVGQKKLLTTENSLYEEVYPILKMLKNAVT